MENTLEYLIVESTLFFTAIVLHVIAIFILRKTNEDFIFTKVQKIFLINLSINEIFSSFSHCLGKVAIVYFPEQRTGSKYYIFFEITMGTLLPIWYMLIMLVITVDRFLAVYLNLRYHLLVTQRKVKILLYILPVVSIIVTGVLNFVIKDNSSLVGLDNTLTVFRMAPVFDVICLLAFCMTYGYLFYQLRKKRRTTSVTEKDNTQTKIKHKFFFPFLLILSFILLWMLPNWIHYSYFGFGGSIPASFHWAVDLCYPLAFICDAFIYIFSSPKVRNKVKRFLNRH
ncbi:adrenocorticotropic hormone receptor-like [Clytia hemisphaerica]|uniref:G-protein coupled receptors family 1 profile domain-containing protein n=1 Tax=Clytia hemisphaerica TaxID=252671 RepID=A0A7M5U282_9CNID